MDIFKVKELMQSVHADNIVDVCLDKDCVRKIEIMMTDGKINPLHHVEFQKCKIKLKDGSESFAEINGHRENMSLEDIKKMVGI